MAAIIGKNADFIDDVIKRNSLKIVIANDNSPMQVVVSGLIEDIINSEQVFFDIFQQDPCGLGSDRERQSAPDEQRMVDPCCVQ